MRQASADFPEKEGALSLKERGKHILKNLDAYVAGVLFAITMVLVIMNVFTRYIFNFVLAWSEEVATSCFVYTVFIGAAWCLRTRQHVGVDLLVERLPGKAREVVHLLTDVVILVLNSYITYLAVLFMRSSKAKTMPIMKISVNYLYAALLIGFGLMAIYSLVHCIEDVRKMARPEGKEVQG